MKTSPIRYALFAASAILLLAGCVKMPKPGTQNPEEPDNPDSPPPTEYLYPFGDEPGQITAEIALSFGPGTDLSAAHIEIPPLKYNKSLLLLLTQDDCKQAAFSTTWAAINGRPLSDTYFYNAPHLRGGDMPPDTYSFGKALGSTDGTGREVRFSFTTAISPEWGYMDDKAVVRPGFTENYYRFFMRAGLMWDDVIEMLNYGVGIAFHDVNTLSVDVPDSIRAHFVSSQRIILDRLAGRGCKMLIEPNGNKAYVAAAEGYDPIQTIFLQSGGEKLRPFAVNGDLLRTRIERGLWLPAAIPAVIEAQMARPVEEREAVNIGVHGTEPFLVRDAAVAQQHLRPGWRRLPVDACGRGVFRIQLSATPCRRKRAGDGKHAHADGRDARRTLFLLSFADDQSSGRRSRSLHGGRRR